MRVGVSLVLVGLLCGMGHAESVHVRRSIFTLHPNGPEIASLRRGIQVMQSRPPTDPTSWIYQANIHDTYDQPTLRGWNQCQHGSFFFFPWHRMYLYYFERILRAASGDPDLTLPYWNYTDDPNVPDPDQAQIPLAFRQPADASNPLFVAQRDPNMNDGGYLPPGIVDTYSALNFTNFDAPERDGNTSFGGSIIPRPDHFTHTSDRPGVDDTLDYGSLELLPHNAVHVAIGGELPGRQHRCDAAWMSDPSCAARDPIFLVHHANVDRLWKRWLGQGIGRQDPTSDHAWMDTMFTFFDEKGKEVTLSDREILDTVSQLDYCYDDDPGCVPTIRTKQNVPITVIIGGYWIILEAGR